jgi:hypothetical protein
MSKKMQVENEQLRQDLDILKEKDATEGICIEKENRDAENNAPDSPLEFFISKTQFATRLTSVCAWQKTQASMRTGSNTLNGVRS